MFQDIKASMGRLFPRSAMRPGRNDRLRASARRLRCEPLEQRQLLDAAPWAHPDGTIHYYEAVSVAEGIDYSAADEAATAAGGYLATITSQEENDFVFDLIDSAEYWHERPAGGILAGPWLGGVQPDGSTEPDGGWQWVTGEAFTFVNWSPGEPDNLNDNQDRIHFGEIVGVRESTWNDHEADDQHLLGYVIEYDSDPAEDDDHTGGVMTIEQTLSDQAQQNTIAFDGLAFLTGSLGADSFLPPGKVADFWGFQYLRDNDPSEMGHNTDFLTKAANNMLYVLTDAQIEQLVGLAETQVDGINQYAYDRFVLMDAFRRLLEGDLPEGTTGLDADAVKAYSAQLYRIDGEISLQRAEVMGGILSVLTDTQLEYLDAMVGQGMTSWPDVGDQLDPQDYDHDVHVAVMTYAGDMFSWYAGSVEADVYFCPERQGTYFGSFYLKDAPAMGNPDYTIDSNLTAEMGVAFLETLTAEQAQQVTDLVDIQRDDLYEIVDRRTDVATELRRLIDGDSVDGNTVLDLMQQYGELDGEIVYNYATTFAQVGQSLTSEQEAALADLRAQLGVSQPDGAYLYSEQIDMPEIPNSDFLFTDTTAVADVTYAIVDTGQTTFYDNSGEIAEPAEGDAFYGQDAQFDGNQPSYMTSGDGLTVLDNVTGLTWTQNADWDGDDDIDTNDKFTWVDAQSYVDTLNTENYGGHSDWRLPSIKELYSLIDFDGVTGMTEATSVPYIDTDYFAFGYGDEAAGERIIDAQYWSSTEYVSTTMNGDHTVFGVNFADGRIKGYGTADPGTGTDKTQYVRYVRGNTDYGINDFVATGDGTVTDNATGLTWAQDDSGVGMDWEAALAWVQEMNDQNYLGHNDWRLPNAKELQSIVDYTRSPDTTGSAAIDPLFNVSTITDDGGETDYPFFWTSTTHLDGPPELVGNYAVYVAFGEAEGWMQPPSGGEYNLMDVHGAGSQRSDPKSGDPDDYPYGNGPQGDVIRIYNYARLVRDTDDGDQDLPPTAEAGGPYSGDVDATITLDGSASTDADGSIVLYEWDLDNDGQYDDTTGVTTEFQATNAGTYTVGLHVTDNDATTDTDTATVTVTEASVEQLGPIAFLELPALDPSAGGLWYGFETVRQGLLTVEAIFAGAPDSVALTLYDQDNNELSTSALINGNQRVDWQAEAGVGYYIRLSGTDDNVGLRLANLVQPSLDGSEVTVYGTDGDDMFETSFGGSYVLAINGVRYESSQDANLHFFGNGGTDTATLTGSEGNEVATLYPSWGTMAGSGYQVDWSDVASVTVGGGGGDDKVTFYGSTGDDTLAGWLGGGVLIAPGGTSWAFAFREVLAYASDGDDIVKLYDSPGDDDFVVNLSDAFGGFWYGDGSIVHTWDFDEVHAFAPAGGFDSVKFYDSPGDDTYYGTPSEAGISGNNIFGRAKSFELVRAFAIAGGHDVGSLYDSPGEDIYVGAPVESMMIGDGYLLRGKFFEEMHGYASDGDYDVARLYDSRGDDLFETYPEVGTLSGDTFATSAHDFDGVNAYCWGGGYDVAMLHGSPGDDTFYATPSEGMIWGPGFYHRAKDFAEVIADGGSGGNDKAYLHDSALIDLLEADDNWAKLSNDRLGFACWAYDFAYVKATSSSRPEDAEHDLKSVTDIVFTLDLEPEGAWDN